MMTGCWLWIGVVIVLAVLLGFVGRRYERKRADALRATASAMGFQFAADDETDLRSGLTGFNLFTRGANRSIKNVAYGRLDEAEVLLFDYSYTTNTGDESQTHCQTVAFFQSDALDMPEFVARPEGLLDKIGQVFGSQDIDLPAHPDFSRRYLLRGADEGRIRRFFTPAIAQFFEANPRLSIEANFDRFILYGPGYRLGVKRWLEWLAKGRETFQVLRGSKPISSR